MIGFSVSAAFVSIVWVLLEGWLAYRNGMLTPMQMLAKHPGRRGLPFIAHGGMWGDIILLSPLAGFAVGTHGGDWTLVQIVIMFVIGMMLSVTMHLTYVRTKFPDSLAWEGEGVTAAGWLHVVYMGVAFAIIGLLYFYTPSSNPLLVSLAGLLLSMHVVIGTHIPLGSFNELEPMGWCPNFFVPPTGYVVLGAWGILIAMTMFAVGIPGGFLLILPIALFSVLAGMRFPSFLSRLF